MARTLTPYQLAVTLALLLAGCTSEKPDVQNAAPPFAGQQIRLLVVDDPALATAAERFQGEWRARTGAEFEVQRCTAAELLGGNRTADAVIYPSYLLGDLAHDGHIVAVPKDVLDHADLAWQEIFELLRLREATWGTTVYAIPLGTPQLICYYRRDLLERAQQRPPQTWSQYQDVAARLQKPDGVDDGRWSPTLEPLGPGWAGLTFLARAACYAKHPDYFSMLFDLDTMEPLIANAAFTRALEELVAAAKAGSPDQLNYSPDDVRAAFWRGECGLALTWPTASRSSELPADSELDGAVCSLPGSTEVFHPETGQWITRDAVVSMPVLGLSGRLGSVFNGSKHQAAAFQLLIELSGLQWSGEVSAASSSTTLFRQSHLQSPASWVERPLSKQAGAYARIVEQSLQSHDAAAVLTMPGREEYLAALDDAVRRAVRGNLSPAEALAKCAAAWREITDRLGLPRQREAHQQSVIKQP